MIGVSSKTAPSWSSRVLTYNYTQDGVERDAPTCRCYETGRGTSLVPRLPRPTGEDCLEVVEQLLQILGPGVKRIFQDIRCKERTF